MAQGMGYGPWGMGPHMMAWPGLMPPFGYPGYPTHVPPGYGYGYPSQAWQAPREASGQASAPAPTAMDMLLALATRFAPPLLSPPFCSHPLHRSAPPSSRGMRRGRSGLGATPITVSEHSPQMLF